MVRPILLGELGWSVRCSCAKAMRLLTVATACLLAGCGAPPSDLRFLVDNPGLDAVEVIALEHAAAVHFGPREVPGATLPGGTIVYAAESPDVCSTLQMGFLRGEEHFAFVVLREESPDTGSVSLWGPDDACESWAEGAVPVIADTGGENVFVGFESPGLAPKDNHPWAAARVVVEGSAEAEVCPDVDVFALQCGVPVGSE